MILHQSLLLIGLISIVELIIYSGIGIGMFIFFRKANQDKTKFGINLKRVYCPVCKTKQPIIRIPKNQMQMLYGGTTCPKCQANLDKYGDVIM